jgi:hypothetical protein
MLVAGSGLCAMCGSRALHLRLSHISFWVERDAYVDAGFQSMFAAVGFAVIRNCSRREGRRSIVGVRSRQRAWADVIELQADGEWSIAAFKVSCIAVVVVRWLLAAAIGLSKRLVVGQARMVRRRGRSLCERQKESSWAHFCCKAKQSRMGRDRCTYRTYFSNRRSIWE